MAEVLQTAAVGQPSLDVFFLFEARIGTTGSGSDSSANRIRKRQATSLLILWIDFFKLLEDVVETKSETVTNPLWEKYYRKIY